MTFKVSSPETFMLSQDELGKSLSNNSRIAIGVLGFMAIAIQVMNFVIVNNFMQNAGVI
jgi:hypothetical protein